MVLPNTNTVEHQRQNKRAGIQFWSFSSSVLESLTGVQNSEIFFKVFQTLPIEVLICAKRHPQFSQVNIFPVVLSQRDLDTKRAL